MRTTSVSGTPELARVLDRQNRWRSTETGAAFNNPDRGQVYNAFVMTIHLKEVVTPNGDWPERFLEMKENRRFDSIPYEYMGFPSNWREYAIWQRHLQMNG